ncbi:MAG: diguanylate cyclase [Deltaproteobacteria bacterium]|nr:diguanylate cyclase [Deltaproteobacteria bacterium]
MKKRISDLSLSTKFLGAIGIILIILTIWDIRYNAEKEKRISHQVIKDWAFLFAENVRVSLNELMKSNKMEMRFRLFESMSEELTGLKDVRVIRGNRTNEIFHEINEKDIIPKLEIDLKSYGRELSLLKEKLTNTSDSEDRLDLEDEILYVKENITLTLSEINELRRLKPIDIREQAKDAVDEEVIRTGRPIYLFEGDNARVLIPYKARKKGCTEQLGCHKYAKEGDVLGAINLEFSVETINKEIRENNIKMAGFWFMRLIVFFTIISLLLSFIITKNLQNILKTFKKISGGDLSVRVPVKNRDEIGTLSEGFNGMAASLESTKKELGQRLLELFTIYNISKTMNSTLEIEALLEQLVNNISESMKIEKILIMLVSEDREEIYVASAIGFDTGKALEYREKIGQGLYGRAILTGRKKLIEDIGDGPSPLPEELLSEEINSVLIIPFMRRGEVLGLICGYKDKPEKFNDSDVQLFNSIAEHVCVAMENTRLFEEIKKIAIKDGLTGLYNKLFFHEKLEMEQERAKRNKQSLSLLLMGLDNLKDYNDTNGQGAGDDLLKELSSFIKSSIRKIDIPCRYDEEELALILPETGKEGALKLAESLVEKINNHSFQHRKLQAPGFVYATIGVASLPDDAKTPHDLIRKADQALSRAKSEGSNRIILCA